MLRQFITLHYKFMSKIKNWTGLLLLLLLQTSFNGFAQGPPPCDGPGLPPCQTFQDDVPIDDCIPFIIVLAILFVFYRFYKSLIIHKAVD